MQVFGVPPAEGAVKVFFVPLLLTFFFLHFCEVHVFHKQIYFPIIADHERNDASSDSGKNIGVTAAALC